MRERKPFIVIQDKDYFTGQYKAHLYVICLGSKVYIVCDVLVEFMKLWDIERMHVDFEH